MFDLPRSRMIKRRNDFQRVYRSGRSFACHHLVMYVLRDEHLAGRVGFAAGKKLGCAVVRVRVKRLLRECWRLHQAELPEDWAVLLVGRRPMVEAKCQAVERDYVRLLRRVQKAMATKASGPEAKS